MHDELFLRSEQEWRLYESLKNNNISVKTRALSVSDDNSFDERPRASFELSNGDFILVLGAAQYELNCAGMKKHFPNSELLVSHLLEMTS